VLVFEVLHINLHHLTNHNRGKVRGEVTKFVEVTSTTCPIPVAYFYDEGGRRACVTDYLVNLLPSPVIRNEYKTSLHNVLWLHPVGHLDNLLVRIEGLQDDPSGEARAGANGLATYALAAATWAVASLSYTANNPSSTPPLHENLPESVLLYAAARTALTIAETADPGNLANTDVIYTAVMMMVYLTHASSLRGTHLPTSGLSANDYLQLEVRRVLSLIQRFWKTAGWFADPTDGPIIDPNRVTSHWEKEERRRLSSAILYYEE
jgi:hypothetical protein